MKRVKVARADPTGQQIEDVIIEITQKLPDFDDQESAARYYDAQAQIIAAALQDSLPQATFERLVAELLHRAAGIYRRGTGAVGG